jgi:hypothetical protein
MDLPAGNHNWRRLPRKNGKRILICGLLLALAGRGLGADGLSAGPLICDFPLTLGLGHRTEVLGPLFYSEQNDTQKTWAIPPLMSHVSDSGTDSEEFDFAYPLMTLDRFGTEYRWHVAQLFSFAGGHTQPDNTDRRFTLFPIYFQQRSTDPARNYTAVFPIYGHLQNRLFRDKIFFVMFPIFGETWKKDIVTDNYFYPVFHVRHGDGLQGWQFWPLVGHEHKEPTMKTNMLGDIELRGGHDNVFVVWPVFYNQTTGIGTENPERQQGFLPLYGWLRSPQRDVTTVIWPLISHVNDRQKHYTEWETPWPLIVFARGEGKTTSRVWPFYSHAQNTNLESRFFLWPLYKFNRTHSDPLDRRRTRILLFLYSDAIQKNTANGEFQRRIDCWPFFTRTRDYNGSTRLQMFSILEPILPTTKSTDRDYSQLWSVWRAEKNTRTGATSRSLLWNLYRCDTTPASRKCSLLFGLFQYQSGSEGKRVRLFYVPVSKTKPGPGK